MLSVIDFQTGITSVIFLADDDVFDLPGSRGVWTRVVQIMVRWNGDEPFFLLSATGPGREGLYSSPTIYTSVDQVPSITMGAANQVYKTLDYMQQNAESWRQAALRSVAR